MGFFYDLRFEFDGICVLYCPRLLSLVACVSQWVTAIEWGWRSCGLAATRFWIQDFIFEI